MISPTATTSAIFRMTRGFDGRYRLRMILLGLCVVAGFGAARAEPALEPEPPAATALPRALDARSTYRLVIEREVRGTGLPAEIAEAVMGVESGYNPARIGADGEIGLMQLMPSTARMLGFSGSLADLAVPETNIRLGVTYLAQAWQKAGHDLCTALMKYRAGHGESRFSYLSVNYCIRARGLLAARGFRVVGEVPVATFGGALGPSAAGGVGCRKKCFGGTGAGRVDFAALNSRLTTVVMQTGPRSGVR